MTTETFIFQTLDMRTKIGAFWRDQDPGTWPTDLPTDSESATRDAHAGPHQILRVERRFASSGAPGVERSGVALKATGAGCDPE